MSPLVGLEGLEGNEQERACVGCQRAFFSVNSHQCQEVALFPCEVKPYLLLFRPPPPLLLTLCLISLFPFT